MNEKPTEVETSRELLRSRGLRATPARIAVISILERSTHPVTHLDVSAELEQQGYDKSTIFRALGDLTEAGLLRKMELGDHVWRFERLRGTTGDESASHPHLLCVDCGNVECLDEDQVQLKASQSVGPIEDVLLKGRCRDCR